MVRISDIADAAKVSTATVSRVLNNDKRMSVSSETRKRILDISKELGYVPVKQRKVQTNKELNNQKVGIIMYCSQQYEWEDVYFLSIRKGIEQACKSKGLSVTKIIHLGDNQVENAEGLDGVIVVGGPNKEEEKKLHELMGANIVYVNNLSINKNCDHIGIDFKTATEKALNYLFESGHRHIGYIGGKEHEWQKGPEIKNPRKIAFNEIMSEHNQYNENFVFLSNEFLINDGYKCMKKALKNKSLPTAFFVASDAMAIGAIRALHEERLKVPKDISIVSFNDIEMAQYIQPSLTTVKIFTEEMGSFAVKMLIDRFEGREVPLQVLFPSELIVRESVKRVAK
ncbi:LacI family DNA-binding transcriptional regulator [Gracilibacillus sp. D59]|uniref:LacI family DNA-binding transcriptional regulator n=1 Tax=Gracilibacillus sp. D59 TaxID=3457434 RepID=UPI003FCDB930